MPQTRQDGALPTYLRIAEHLTIEIGTGRLDVGDRLPPERAMAADYKVAVATLRKALEVLEERGLIQRRQGSGNYVLGGNRNVGTYALFRLEKLPNGGGLPTARILDMVKMKKPADLPDIGAALSLAMRIRRLRFLSYEPVAVEEIWLDGRYIDDNVLKPELLSESLYRTYATRLGLQIVKADDRIGVAPLPDWSPEELGLAPGHAMGFIARRAFNQQGEPAEFSRTWFDPDRARYYARVP